MTKRQTLSYCPYLRAISRTKGNHLLYSYEQITYWCVSVGIIHFYRTEADQGCHSITPKCTSSSATISISHPPLFCSVPYYNYWKLRVLITFLLIHSKEDFVRWPQLLDQWKWLLLHSVSCEQKRWQNPHNLGLYDLRGDIHILF